MMAHSAALRGVAQPFWCRWFLSPIVEFVNILLICLVRAMSTYIQSSINTATLINASEKRRQTRTAQTLPSKAKVKEEILSLEV